MSSTVPRVGLEGRALARDEQHLRRSVPLRYWAAAGAVILAFETYVLTEWVTGPHFESVPAGPSPLPGGMKTALDLGQWLSIPIALVVMWFVLVRPWLRDREPTTDGLLCLAFLALSWQDPLSAYFGHWFSYNSYLFNRGSWAYEIPGWTSFGQPGAELAQPLFVFTPLYIFVFLGLAVLGSKVMRAVRNRAPRLGVAGQLLACWAVLAAMCLVVEGFIYLPLGFYTYTGGHLSLFPDTYHKLPLHEIVLFGALFTPMAALRFYVNDRGESLAERGASELRLGRRAKIGLRFLALSGFVQLAMLVSYNLPGMFVGANSTRWPDDVQKRSYFTVGMCGQGTGRACPGEGQPLLQPRYLDGAPRVVPRER